MTDRELLNLAREAAANAYCPYSRFPVGAALECTNGRIFTGCNVENMALGSTMCAERIAIYKAVSEGITDFHRLAIYGEGDEYCMPCGACRQVIAEIAMSKEIPVLICGADGSWLEMTADELLPHSFELAGE